MLSCPRCGEDYSETGLDHGRCRRCGHVITALAGFMPPPGSRPRFEASSASSDWGTEAAGSELSKPALSETVVVPTVAGEGTVRSETAGETVQAQHPPTMDVMPADLATQVIATWGGQLAENSQVTHTLKVDSGDEVASEVQVSHGLIVPRRGVRGESDSPGGRHDYELEEFIARGAEGMIHAARQTALDRSVAMKMIRSDRARESNARQKFLTEAVITGSLEHPNIVPIHDLGTTNDGTLFYVMKRIRGTPWSAVIHERSLVENLSTLMRVADAVGLAHSQGVIHRDLKPENVMLGDFGEVLLTDWGIALCTPDFENRHRLSSGRFLGGTPAYMAPEMVTGPIDKIGPAADIYLLGAILHEVVTGFPPHTGESVMECLQAAARNEIRDTEASGELFDVARRALATDPVSRFASVQEFQAAIRLYQSHSESVLLTDQAKEDLRRARAEGDYGAYSTAVFGFQKAIELWAENHRAANLLVIARSEYANAALGKGDLDLARSQLDPSENQHRALVKRIATAQRERDARQRRLVQFKRLAMLLVGAFLCGGGLAVLWINQARRDAELEKGRALGAEFKALREGEAARLAAEDAAMQRDRARSAAVVARRERERSELAREAATEALRSAREASYASSISLAVNSIANQAFTDALAALRQQQANPDSSWLRHWEWGRQMYLCLGGDPRSPRGLAVVNLPTGESAEELMKVATVVDPGGRRWLAVPTQSGKLLVWERVDAVSRVDWRGPRVIAGTVALHDVAFSPDGKVLASAGADGVIRLHRMAELDQPPTTLEGHRGAVMAVEFCPVSDPPRLASAAADRTIKLWEVNGQSPPRTLVGHTDLVQAIAFAPDGRRLVSASDDFTARVWDVIRGVEVQRFDGHQDPVFCVRFSPDGGWVASGGYDKRVLVWRADRFEPIAADLVREVEDRVRLQGGGGTVVPVHELAGHTAAVTAIDFSADGRRIVSGSRDNTLRLWSMEAVPTAASDERPGLRVVGGQVVVPLQTLRGHGGWLSGCRFLGTDEIVSSALDRQLKVWLPERYREVDELSTAGLPILAASFAPDGQTVAVAFSDGTAGIWDKVTGDRLATLEEGHEYLTSNAAFLPDGKRLVTIAGDDTMRMWDVERGGELWAVEGTGRRGLLATSPTGGLIATGSRDGKVARLWDESQGMPVGDLDTGQLTELLAKYPDASPVELARQVPDLTALVFSPDGNRIATADSSGRGLIWQIGTAEPLLGFRGHDRAVTVLLWLQNPEQLISGSADGTVTFWDPTSGLELPGNRLVHGGPVSLLTAAPDGSALLTVATEGTLGQRLYHWDLRQRELLGKTLISDVGSSSSLEGKLDRNGEIRTRAVIGSVAFSPDREEALIATFDPEVARYAVWKWDLGDAAALPVRQRDLNAGLVFSARYDSSQAHRIVTTGGSGARLWDRLRREEVMNYQPHAAILSIDHAPDGRRVVTAGTDHSIKVWYRDDQADRWLSEEKLVGIHGGQVTIAKFLRASEKLGLVSGGADGRALLWERREGRWSQVAELVAQGGAIRAIALSSDGERVATAAEDSPIRVWNLADRVLESELSDHRGPVLGLAFSNDSRRLVSGGSDNQAVVWDLATGSPVRRLVGHSAPIESVGLSPDGWRVITGSQDGTVKLWDIHSPARGDRLEVSELLTLAGHGREVTQVMFDTQGKQILSTGRDGRALLWNSVDVEPAIIPRLSRLTYQPDAVSGVLQAAGIHLKFPTGSRFGGDKIEIRLPEGEALPGERLELLESVMAAGGWRREGDRLWRRVPERAVGSPMKEIEFGRFVSGESSDGILLELADGAEPESLLEFIEAVGYRCDPIRAETDATTILRPLSIAWRSAALDTVAERTLLIAIDPTDNVAAEFGISRSARLDSRGP